MWVVGSLVSETFYTGASGEAFTRTGSYVAGSATAFAPTFTDLGGGWYRYTYTPTTAGAHEWYGSGSGSGPLALNFVVVTAAQADPVAALGSTEVTVVSPVSSTGIVSIRQGDDYSSSDDRGLVWSSSGWPNLTGATVTWTLKLGSTTALTKAATVGNAGGAPQSLAVSLTAAETAALQSNQNYTYDIAAVLSSGRKATLVTGDVDVALDATP